MRESIVAKKDRNRAFNVHMRSCSLLLLFSSGALTASASPLPGFSERLLPPPELSLSEAVKSGKLPGFGADAPPTAKGFSKPSAGQARYLSRMPVIDPGKQVDRKMPVIAPKPGIDFKMIVKAPDVEVVK